MRFIACIQVVFLLILSGHVLAKVELPSMLSSNMVLQQRSEVKLWGTATARANVEIKTSWDQRTYTVKVDADGSWETAVTTPMAGGPYSISFDDGERLTLDNILIGEVWVCSGQSNMAMRLKGGVNQPTHDLHAALLRSNNDQIRLFTVQKASADMPQTEVNGQWKVSNPKNALEFSAVAFWYGTLLQEYLQVPVGLVVTSVGGTPVRSWMPAESLGKIPEARVNLNGKQPEVLYNGMIAPLKKYAIKGFLWYQGESDHRAPARYAQQLEAMVEGWRAAWGNETLPFYYVQIAPWLYPGDPTIGGAAIREQQLLALNQIPNSGMAVTLDIGSNKTVHPSEKKTVGSRLAYIALARSYGVEGMPYASPVYKSMTITENKALLTFDHAKQGLYFTGDPNENFEIAGADKKFYPAQVNLTRKGIEVYSDQVSKPVAVRYGYKNYLKGNLYNNYGLPASSFRTGDWDLAERP